VVLVIKWFVKNYENHDFYLKKKAEYSFKFIITMLLAIALIISVDTAFGNQKLMYVISGYSAMFMFGICLYLIHVGKYTEGINLMIILGIARLIMLFNYESSYQFYAMIPMILVAINVVYNKAYQVVIMEIAIYTALIGQCYRIYNQARLGIVEMHIFYEIALSLFLYLAIIYFIRYIRGIIDREISENEKLMTIAERDALTSLYNKRKITEHFNDFLEKSRVFKIILFDIDDFKRVNDTYGHNIGDEILIEISDLIMRRYNKSGFARWGGEEFLLIVEAYDDIAEEIRALVQNHEFSNHIKVTVSIGQTTVTGADTIVSAVKRADEAMYTSKRTGKNKVTIL
jgi:diguanylate cyclase (GGDEF)-like protein